MDNKLSVDLCLAFNKCIAIDAIMFKRFLIDLEILSLNNYGYKYESTKPSSDFYGLFLHTLVQNRAGLDWYKIRQKLGNLSNVENEEVIAYLKQELTRECPKMNDNAIDFLFKYDMFIENFYRTKTYYNDTLISLFDKSITPQDIVLISKYIDFVDNNIDHIDEINHALMMLSSKDNKYIEVDQNIGQKLLLKK